MVVFINLFVYPGVLLMYEESTHMVLEIGHSVLKLVKTTRNELRTVPKTSMKLKQTMLDLYPDDFSCRSYRSI